MKKVLFLVVLSMLEILSACASPSADKGYKDISVAELQTMLESKDFLFVNTHIPFDVDIPNTDLSIPFNEVEQYLDQLPSDKDAQDRIVLPQRYYERSGSRRID